MNRELSTLQMLCVIRLHTWRAPVYYGQGHRFHRQKHTHTHTTMDRWSSTHFFSRLVVTLLKVDVVQCTLHADRTFSIWLNLVVVSQSLGSQNFLLRSSFCIYIFHPSQLFTFFQMSTFLLFSSFLFLIFSGYLKFIGNVFFIISIHLPTPTRSPHPTLCLSLFFFYFLLLLLLL